MLESTLEEHRIRGQMSNRILLIFQSDYSEDTRSYQEGCASKTNTDLNWSVNENRDPRRYCGKDSGTSHSEHTGKHGIQTTQTTEIADSSSRAWNHLHSETATVGILTSISAYD
jgi:hypothetical protein